ncbi:MAG: acetolactate synthase small subunit [Candidatus Gracilibacteria bacterium]|jgi:acetolactate synthase-1/3 small subunit|nr:acetolactate synthase small subunit [Candidatus Gracilibacteria bacterium]
MKSHVLIIKAKNSHGVLGKITNLLRRRMFNIEGMTAGYTNEKGISHVTVAFSGDEEFNAEQAKKQLSKIIEVISVKELESNSVMREMALIRLHCSEKTKAPIFDAAKLFEGKIISVGDKSVVIEITGTPRRIDQFHDLVRGYGVKEFIRSSLIAVKED